MGKRALIVVDMQNDYFPGGRWVLENVEEAAKNAGTLLSQFRERGDLVIHIQHEAGADAPFFVRGSKGAEINESVRPLSGEAIIRKEKPNSFLNTELKALLVKHSIEDVYIAGAMTHVCVDAITRASSDFGYRTFLIHDACASRDLEFEGVLVPARQVHAAFMAALKFGYASVLSTKQTML